VTDWDAFRAFAHEEIVHCLQPSAKCMEATSLREQYFHACEVIRVQHRLAMPFPITGKLLNVSKASIGWNYQQYLIQIIYHDVNG
jgi:hypothetical protein